MFIYLLIISPYARFNSNPISSVLSQSIAIDHWKIWIMVSLNFALLDPLNLGISILSATTP